MIVTLGIVAACNNLCAMELDPATQEALRNLEPHTAGAVIPLQARQHYHRGNQLQQNNQLEQAHREYAITFGLLQQAMLQAQSPARQLQLQYFLGAMFYHGQGVPADHNQATELLTQVANNGAMVGKNIYAAAKCLLGIIYYKRLRSTGSATVDLFSMENFFQSALRNSAPSSKIHQMALASIAEIDKIYVDPYLS